MNNNVNKLKCYCISDKIEIEKSLELRYNAFIGEKLKGDEKENNSFSSNKLGDDIDDKAYHFGVYDNDELVAGARYAINKKSDIAAFRFFPEYSYDFFSNVICKRPSICVGEPDWVVVKKEYRFSPASIILLFNIIDHMMENYQVDIIVAMIEEGNLIDFYRKFGFSIISDSKREIDGYGNGNLTTSYIGYLSIDERFLQNSSSILLQGLLEYDKDYYEEKIKKFRRKIVQKVSYD